MSLPPYAIEVVTDGDLTACHAVRHEVFVVEQGISVAEEMDAYDVHAVHLLASSAGRPVGTVRFLPGAAADK